MSAKKTDAVYCICRSSDGTGFMIECDNCEVWYHGRCIDLKKKDADKLPNFICGACLGRPRCANPKCLHSSRVKSKYCSDQCGYEANKLRFEKLFLPKWLQLEEEGSHSIVRLQKMKQLQTLEKEKEDVITHIGTLREERNELEATIKAIKGEATRLRELNSASREREENGSDVENEEREDNLTAEQSKSFSSCITCAVTIPSENRLKHWTSCHKKQESQFNFSSDIPVNLTCATDPKPDLYCQRPDKKSKRYCLHLRSTCSQHSNWNTNKSEVCGCPLKVMQKLELDGDLCLELKKNCLSHYHWDRFRLATKDTERLEAFNKLDVVFERIVKVQASLNDTYGGVIGLMMHNTKSEMAAIVEDTHEDVKMEMSD